MFQVSGLDGLVQVKVLCRKGVFSQRKKVGSIYLYLERIPFENYKSGELVSWYKLLKKHWKLHNTFTGLKSNVRMQTILNKSSYNSCILPWLIIITPVLSMLCSVYMYLTWYLLLMVSPLIVYQCQLVEQLAECFPLCYRPQL